MRAPTRIDISARFASKYEIVTETGCWLWTGASDKFGYGSIGSGGKRGRILKAYRVSWELHVGPIPAGLHVLHKCDVPACVNPAHLFLGTHTDNMRDMTTKGRNTGSRGKFGALNTASKPVIATNLSTGERTRYAGVSEAGRLGGFGFRMVSAVCLGKRRAHHGHTFMFDKES